ncbi:MAG: terminase small subunit [Methylomicrobium sp.]|nr:terminase small subunit [Methylomicrobium sp.]
MKLTPKQEKFAQCVADGNNQAEAYRLAYPKARNWKPETVWSNASNLMSNTQVLARVEELKAALAEKRLWTREDSVRELKRVVADPDKAADIIAAVKELNAMHGFNSPQKIDFTNSDGSLAPTRIEIVCLTDDDGTDSDSA